MVVMTPAVAFHTRMACKAAAEGNWGSLLAADEEATVPCLTEGNTATPETTRSGQTKLMVVDDDPEVRGHRLLNSSRTSAAVVLQASNGADALDLLASTPDLRA